MDKGIEDQNLSSREINEKAKPRKIPPDTVVKNKAENGKQEFDLERQREFAVFYKGFIGRLLSGDHSVDATAIINTEDKMLAERMIESASSGFKAQATKMALAQMDARGVLSQVFKTPNQQQFLADTSRYTLKEHAEGVYEINVDRELFKGLFAKEIPPQAVAVKIPNGISFFIYSPLNNPVNEARAAENLPHETHHLAWTFMEKDGIFLNTEENPEMKKAFSTYREEMIAKMLTESIPYGNDHFTTNPKRQQQIQEENPELYKSIRDVGGELYDLVDEIRYIREKSPIKYSDLILPAARSSNFKELKSNLVLAKDYINTHANPK